MIRVIAADDEQYLRKALPNMIPWRELGAELIKVCQNGRELVEACTDLMPDIVITDIRMPLMDGMEVCKYLKENLPGIKVILLSAYSDFSYARNALKYGVTEYILKADVLDELAPAVERTIKELIPDNRAVTVESQTDKGDKALFESLLEYVNMHYREELTLADVAEALHANPSYLSRMYKSKTGNKLFDDILKMRIEKAKESLLVTDMKINDIAEYVGFNDSSYFSRSFKKITGISPKEYREQRTNTRDDKKA